MRANGPLTIVLVSIVSSCFMGLQASTDPRILMLEQINTNLINLFECDTESQKFSQPFCRVVCEKIEKSGDPLRSILDIDLLINQMTARLASSAGDREIPSISPHIYAQALAYLLYQIQGLGTYEYKKGIDTPETHYIRKLTREWCGYMQQSNHAFHFFQLIAEHVKASGLLREQS